MDFSKVRKPKVSKNLKVELKKQDLERKLKEW